MKRLLVVLSALAATACASLKADDAPNCSGARRPANPHGSILAPEQSSAGAVGAGQCGSTLP